MATAASDLPGPWPPQAPRRNPRPSLRIIVQDEAHRRRSARVTACRRRRAMALAVVALLGVATGLAVPSLARPTPAPVGVASPPAPSLPAPPAPVRVVVTDGDTVWELARSHLPPGRRLRDYVAEVIVANDLDPGVLLPGTVLALPRG